MGRRSLSLRRGQPPKPFSEIKVTLRGSLGHIIILLGEERIKNPVKDVGVTTVWGLDHPEYIAEQTGLAFIAEHDMTPEDMIDQLEERERKFFRVMFGGKMAKKLYRLYEYKGD